MAAEFLDAIPILKWVIPAMLSSSVLTVVLTKVLGKTKEEADIVLNWEKIHAERDRKLLAEIKRLEDKIDSLVADLNKEKDQNRVNLQKWENSDRELRKTIEYERDRNTKLDIENEELRKENEKYKK
jgi:Xaa-Pro aminopeptidase